MALIARAWLELYAVAPLEPMQKAARVPVELGPPPSPNRAEFPYQGSLIYQGIPIYVENVKGSVRSGVGPDGPWSVTMPAHYGEFVETRGMDGDPIDVFVGTDAAAPMAYVVHQKIPGSQRMDEDKVVLGCRSADEAEALYRAAYTKGGFFAGITPWPVDELRAELRRARAWGKRLDTPPWLRDQLRKGRKDDPDKKPHHVEEPEALTAEDEEILDAVWAKVAREGLVKKAAEGHEAARRAALPQEPDQELAKAVQIRNRPGLALRPSRTNPRTRRWVRQTDDPEAREPAPGQKPLPFGRSAATPPQAGPAPSRGADQPARRGIPGATAREAAAPARGEAPSAKGSVTVTPEARKAIDDLYAGLNEDRANGQIEWGAEARIESPSDADVAAMGGADPSTMAVRVHGRLGRVIIQAWLNPDESPYSGKASTTQVTARNGRTYEVRAAGDGTFAVHETVYGANEAGRFLYTAKPDPKFTAKWDDDGEGLRWQNEWTDIDGISPAFLAVSKWASERSKPNLTRLIKPYDEPPGTLQVYNALFTIPKAHQGQGQGVACLARQVEAAGRLGVQVIHCNAARVDELEGRTTFVGYYVWARLGYNASLKDEFDGAWNTRDEQVPPGGARTMHELMATPEGRDWWRENGDSWDAQFDPTPGSASRRILSEYLDAKGGTLRLAKGRSVTFTHELAKGLRPPRGRAWEPAPASVQGGYRARSKKPGRTWDYWYPSATAAREAEQDAKSSARTYAERGDPPDPDHLDEAHGARRFLTEKHGMGPHDVSYEPVVGVMHPKMTVTELEDAIRTDKFENIAMFAPDGSHVFRGDFRTTAKILSELGRHGADPRYNAALNKEAYEFAKENPGCVVTHNHPSGGPLSTQDVVMATAANLAEVRAVSPDGMTYIMARKEQEPSPWVKHMAGAPGDPPQETWDGVRDELVRAYEAWMRANFARATRRMDRYVREQGGNPDEREKAKGFTHEKWAEFVLEEGRSGWAALTSREWTDDRNVDALRRLADFRSLPPRRLGNGPEVRRDLTPMEKAVVMRRRPGLVLRASKTSPGVKRWQRIAVDTSKHDAAWRSQLDGMVRPETTHPRFGTVPAFTQAEADRYHVEIAGEAKANMAKLGARVVSAIRAIGHKWPDVPVRIEASTPGQHAESAATAGHVRVGTGTNAPDFMLDADGRIDDLIEAGDRDFFTDPDVETAYFLLVEAIRDPKKAQSSKVVTLYTARPVADRDRYARASGLPHGVFLTSDPDRAHGLAHDLSGGKADRDVYEVRVRERDLVQTLNARGVKDFQIIGRAGKTIPVVSIERMEKGGRIRLLLKATIRTPKGADGKVDYDAVPVGSSIWVTVTDPSSPLHGRPILISKRPDKTFALIGGSGAKHIQARKHLVMQGGEIRGTQVDEKRAAERKEAEARNAPRKAALRDLRKRQRAETKAAEKSFMEALGIKRRGLDEEQKATIRRAAEEHAKTTFGLDDEAAAAFAKHLTDGVAKKEEARVTREAVRRLDIARQVAGGLSLDEAEAVAGPSEAPVTIGIELPQGFESMTGPEREAAVLGALDEKEAAAHVAEAEDSRFEPDPPGVEPAAVQPTPDPEIQTPVGGLLNVDSSDGNPVDTGPAPPADDLEPPAVQHDPLPAAQAGLTTAPASEPPPSGPPAFQVTLGAEDSPTPEAPPVRPLANVEAARVAIEKFREVVGIHQSAKEIADQIEALPEAELAAPAAVDELRLRADAVSDEDVDRYLAAYRERAMAPPDSGFYDALSPHWNETDGNKLNGAVVNGAGSAIAAIVGNEVAARYDVRRLVDALGPEAAAIAVVQRMREELGPEEFKAFRDKLETSNATGIAATEKKALERHRELQKQSADLEAQVSSGDLQSRATIATLRARNLLEQRENLGGALGSMQASAAMFHFADVAHERGYKRRHEVKINVGTSRLALDDKLKRLGGFKRKIEYDVRTGGYSIVTDTASLRKYVTRTQANEADAAKWREVKNSTADVRVDDEGREWADGYQIPGFRSHFGAEETLPPDQKHLAGKPINALAEQRNNIEWLHGAGGGLVTMRTGGGKTLVSIAVASKALHDNPKGRHLRIVPDGREEQWAAEVQNFTVHKPVVIPAKATKEERHQAIAAAPEGSIVIIGHTPAGKHDYHALGVHGWDSIGIDEPQELRAKSGSGKLSAGAKRIFKLDAPHRHALTATPATDNPVEAYDIVNWTRPGVLGFRSRFASSFSGFGGGTNAQDEAMTRMLYRELEPHVSGERVVPPHYGIHHNDVKVGMTDGQKTRQQAIEAEVEGHIEKRVAEAYQKKRDGVRGYVETSFAALRAKATEKAMGEMEARHRANLGGGDHADNAKLRALSSQLDTAGKDDRHVIFVDSADQRKAVTELLKARGVAAGDVKNITSAAKNATVIKDGEVIGAIEERKRAWKGSKGGYLLIDQSSASGHNLAEGDHLHVLGNPDDAAQLLQVHGRLGRANRSGDFAIHTYRYEDSPFEHHRWNRLHRQLKVLKATAPGMFVEGARNTRTETRLQKGVRALLRLFGRGGTS